MLTQTFTNAKFVKLFGLAALAMLALAGNARAECMGDCGVEWVECDGNGIFQPGGERSGADYYFNVEGVNNGSYASWAGARWTGIDLGCDPGCVCDIESICVTLEQANAGFTTNGPVELWLCPDSIAPQVQDGGSLSYPYVEGGTYLMTYNFVEVSNGHQDVFCLQKGDTSFDALAESVKDGTLVLAFVEGSASVAATWGGIGNYSNGMGGPRLDVVGTCVPEPSTMLLLAIGGTAMILFRRHAS